MVGLHVKGLVEERRGGGGGWHAESLTEDWVAGVWGLN